MEEERKKERYLFQNTKELNWNSFGSNAFGEKWKFLLHLKIETPDGLYAVLLLHSFEATGKVISSVDTKKIIWKPIMIWSVFFGSVCELRVLPF